LALGIPPTSPELGANLLSTVSPEWVEEVYQAALDCLPPELVTTRSLGGGKTIRVLKYKDGFVCRGQSLVIYGLSMIGLAEEGPTDHDGLAWGFLQYTSQPRPENLGRTGRHEKLWFIDHYGNFQTYEPGDAALEPIIATEFPSVTLIYAQ
jgi:hypothetical protein